MVNGGRRLDPAVLRLVVVTDSLRDGVDGLVSRAAAAVAGGATMLQLRLKDESARTLVEVARGLRAAAPGVPLVVNDRADVALAAGAQGVHLGTDDLPAGALRRIVPDGFLIGISASHPASSPASSEEDDADYLAVGPVFGRGGAVEEADALAAVQSLVRRSRLPVLALGGMTEERAARVVAAGAAGVAVISAILGASDPRTRARAFRDVLDASGR